jgi:ferredoxin
VHVWIDQDLCTGDGLCTDHCADVFVLLEDGIAYVMLDGRPAVDPGGAGSAVPVPDKHEDAVIAAAIDCPGECIFVEPDRDVGERGASTLLDAGWHAVDDDAPPALDDPAGVVHLS